MQSYFAAFVSQDYFAGWFPNVSHHLSLMTIDHIVGILCETPCVCKTQLFILHFVAVILALTVEGYKRTKTGICSCGLR